jgi:RND family efflux transporter MFP subunit
MTPATLFRVLAAGLAVALTACSHPASEAVETSAAVPVTVEAARFDTLKSTVSTTGTVVPAPGGDWIITAPQAAPIAELPKAEGEVVHVGDLLVRFDIPTLPAELAAKRAAVDQATARLNTAKATVTRLSGLVQQGIAAPREVEEAKRDQAEAEADLAQAQSGVAAATSLLERAVVKATFDGVIAKRWHNPGDLVDASASDPVLRVINPRVLQVVAAVPIAELTRIELGHTGRIVGPGGGDGEAVKVLTKPAQVDAGSATADVRLTFQSPTKLAAGMVVQVELLADQRTHVLVVPRAAVIHDGDETFVMVAGTDQKAHKHAVTLGLATASLVEVASGLADGDLVIVRGQDGLPDGAVVTVVK